VATYTCPDGHTSASGDYCDVCGLPIQSAASPVATPAGAAGGPPPLPPTGASPAPHTSPLSLGDPGAGAPSGGRACPNCGTDNPPGALFCENCGYDFTTGQLPRPLTPPDGVQSPVPPPIPAPPDGAPASPASSATAAPAAPAAPSAPAGPDAVSWVAEVWVDPDWYASQGVSDPLPSAGAPAVVPLTDRTLLIGRTSTSRNIHPQIDVSADSGVSRRHAQLTTDGQRWWVEDLQSSNGTYIGGAGEALPTTPITPGQRVELEDDDRIYVGAWTRIVVREG
jgi:FHA domain-containing protein/zinc ribbon protein